MFTQIHSQSRTETGADHRHDARPEWGPAKHDPEHPLHVDRYDAFATPAYGTDLRDAAFARPDDN
jgi:hypothetical protein